MQWCGVDVGESVMERLIPGSLEASFHTNENSHHLGEERNCSMKMRFGFIFYLSVYWW